MFKNEEIAHVSFAIIILTFVVSFPRIVNGNFSYNFLGISVISLSLIVLVNIVSKKLTAEYYESKLETRIWRWQRFGFKRHSKMKKPIPLGIILPFLISIITYGKFLWFAVLESNIEGTSARASKRHSYYKFTEMTDRHQGLIISSGILANIVLAIVAYLINFSDLGRWSIYYATFSLIPFGNLDGTKIFIGNRVLWFSLVVVTLVFLSYALFLP